MLDPRTGNQCDDSGLVLVPYETFRARFGIHPEERRPEPAPMFTVHDPDFSLPLQGDFGGKTEH